MIRNVSVSKLSASFISAGVSQNNLNRGYVSSQLYHVQGATVIANALQWV